MVTIYENRIKRSEMANSKMYCTFDCMTANGIIELCSNEVKCELCSRVFKTKVAYYNHTKNNGCVGKTNLLCFCKEPLQNHKCVYLDPSFCAKCAFRFKNMEAAINHCRTDHKDGSWHTLSHFIVLFDGTPANKEVVLPVAQCNDCTTHWNYGQFKKWWDSGDSKTRRHLTRKVLSSEFHDCAIIDLVSIRGKLVCWEKKPSSAFMRIFNVKFPNGTRQVVLDINQRDFAKIFSRIEDKIETCDRRWFQLKTQGKIVHESNKAHNNAMRELFTSWKNFSMPEAQGLFDFTVTHQIDFQHILDQINAVVKSMFTGETLRKILSFTAKMGMCYSSNWNISVISLAVFDFLLGCDIPLDNAQDAVKLLCACLPALLSMFSPKAQAIEDFLGADIVKPVATIISIIVGALFLKSVPKSSSIDEFVASATKLGSFVRAMDNSWKGFSKLAEFLFDYCFEYYTGFPRDVSEANKFVDGVQEWFVACNELCSNDVLERIQVDPKLCRQIERLYLQGLTITTRCSILKLDIGMRRSIENCQRNIAALNDRVSKSGAFCSGPKVEPLIIQLWGESGVGKSGMTYFVAGDILKTEDLLCGGTGIVSEDWANQIYPRNVEQEFFDGYRNQLIVFYDDFGQLRDSQAKPNIEFMEMIRFGNLAPMCLHMAALEQKDKTYFSSKCVILSSNTREYAIESLISKEAFMRRIDVSVEVRVLEKWRIPNSPKLNTDAVVEHFKEPLVPDVYEVRLWKNNQPSPTWIPYSSLRNILCKEYAKKMNRHFELTSVLSKYMNVPLNVDVSKIKQELDKKIRTPAPTHYTFDDLRNEAQSDETQVEEGEFHETINFNCVPNFPEHLQKIAIANFRRWEAIHVFDNTDEEVTYFELCNSYKRDKYHVEFENFADALEGALESFHGNWSAVLHFLRSHMSFLTIKTQIAFASENFKRIMSDAEAAIDFFRDSRNVECENLACWHPTLQKQHFGFQKGCEQDFIAFAIMPCNNGFAFVYNEFVTFRVKKPSYIAAAKSKVSKLLMNLKQQCSAWVDSVLLWCSQHPFTVIYSTIVAMYMMILKYALDEQAKVNQVERDDRLLKAIEEYTDAKESYQLARRRLLECEALTHEHEGLEIGSRVKHAHECENCGMRFLHEHIIHTKEESMKIQPKHLCSKCRHINSEHQSGDNVTAHKPTPKTEFQSGDNVTTHKSVIKTEHQSGDNVTTHKNVVKTEVFGEFLKGVMDEHNVEDENFYQKKMQEQFYGTNKISAELAVDPNAMTISRKVYANTYMISTRASPLDAWQQHVNCVFIRGRIAITVAHLLPILDKKVGGQIKIDGPFKPEGYILPITSLTYRELTYKDNKEKDMMLVIFPSNVHDHQDIMSSLADSQTMSKFKSVPAMLVTPTVIKDKNIFNQRFADVSAIDTDIEYIDRNSQTGKRRLRQHYQYVMHTTNGDCGSFLVLMSNYLPKKIIGMHVAGDAVGRGYAVPINVDDINKALENCPLEAQIKIDLTPIEQVASDFSETPEGDFTPALKAQFIVASPTNTALRKSPIYGLVLPPVSAPAKLSRRVKLDDGTIIDPVLKGLKKTGKIPPYMDPVLIKDACNDVLNMIQTNDQTRKRVLTNLEALTGVEDDEYSNPLNRSSSPGFPWIRDRQGKGKMKWTSDPEGEYKMHEELEKAIEERESMALKNERYPTVWIDTLKDERRPLEKVAIGKTRVFAAGPMDFVVAFRKYFLGFCAHMADNRIDNEVAVGINVYSYDWMRLAKHLQKNGDRVVAGDFGNFDGTLILQILDEIGEMIIKWYGDGEENAQIRRVMWKELINSVHIERDNIYLWTHGHPSGHPLTAILNSLYNSVVCRIVFSLCAKRVGKIVTMKDFRENVSMISYGDDNVLNISSDVCEWFNQRTMTEVFAEIGMEYTDELKNSVEDALPYRHLSEVSFLKRKFRWDEERKMYVAPLDYSVCMEMVNWIRGELDVEEACAVNCQTSAMELSLHGEEVFEKSVALIRAACLKKMKNQPRLLTYHENIMKFEESYGMLLKN